MHAKVGTVEQAVDLVRSADSLAIPLGPGQPSEFLHRLGGRQDFTRLEVYGALLVDLYELFLRPGVHLTSGFFGPAERFLRDAGGSVEFAPADFRRFEPILQSIAPRVMATVATPPNADGYMSLSLHAGASVDELHRCGADPDRLLVVEMNAKFPRTLGLPPEHDHAIHVDEVDLLFESERDTFVLADDEPGEIDVAIAENVARYISDGCTLQTGIGAVPSMVARMLSHGPGGDYGVHSEMFTTGLMHLHRAGKVTNRKGVHDGYSVCTFAAGTSELYAWLDGNRDVRFLPVKYVNSPETIARNRKMVTINGALMVDLSGQVVADTIDGKQFSGVGGHEDFISGPGLELEDRSLVCLPSTATVDGERVSRISATLPAGAIVSTPRHQVDVIITEYGAAELQGRTIRERARALVGIAHPDFREDLAQAADVWPVD
ncbi:MAG: 4-hydroxybutyrate CoA-transferase [Acidimicrobiales bacterium]|nr:4-hydroxybutyrate CoA-transferase [Acidimicrobiales bacterium]